MINKNDSTAKTNASKAPRRRGFRSIISETLGVLRPGAQLIGIHGYRPRDGGVFNIIMSFNSSYQNVVEKSLKDLQEINKDRDKYFRLATLTTEDGVKFSRVNFDDALDELLESMEKSANQENEKGAPIREAYTFVKNSEKKPIPGIKFHPDSKTLHMAGIMIKTIMIKEPPPQPVRQSRPKTLAKDFLRGLLPVGKWRQYRLTEGSFDELKVQGLTLTAEESRALRI